MEMHALTGPDPMGKLGELTADEYDKLGFRIAIYPGLGRNAAGWGIRQALGVLKRDGNTKRGREQMHGTFYWVQGPGFGP